MNTLFKVLSTRIKYAPRKYYLFIHYKIRDNVIPTHVHAEKIKKLTHINLLIK